MPHSPINPPSTPSADDLAGMAWYNSASEETRRFWHCIAGSPAPVDAWIAYRDTAGTVCPPPATETASACLPAPADAGQGVGFCVPPEWRPALDDLAFCVMFCAGSGEPQAREIGMRAWNAVCNRGCA